MYSALPAYAELHCLSNFTFLRGASHATELVARAAELGYAALAITDECSLAGVVRAHVAAREAGLHLIIGSEIRLEDGPRLVLLAADRAGYGRLSSLITLGRRREKKGSYRLLRADIEAGLPGCLALLLPDEHTAAPEARWLAQCFGDRGWIAAALHSGPDDRAKLAGLRELAQGSGLPLVAAGGVLMHKRSRQPLQDVLTAIRLRKGVAHCGHALEPNAERHLRQRMRLAQVYPPELLAATLDIAAQCTFSLDSLRYEYPEELVPAGETPAGHLRKLTLRGLQKRFPQGVSDKVAALVEHELRPNWRTSRFSSRSRTSSALPNAAASCARAAARPPTPPFATPSASPRSTRRACPCCSSVSFRASATSRRTSTSISSTSGARR
jgi:error-prone DNA polymerase